jgi:hypothetical protein
MGRFAAHSERKVRRFETLLGQSKRADRSSVRLWDGPERSERRYEMPNGQTERAARWYELLIGGIGANCEVV